MTTPFGPRIHALAIYLKGFQALSYERLRFLFRDAFGLVISEGALMNMFIRSHAGFKLAADEAKGVLRSARVVASDETGVRIEGTNSYHWVFHCKDAVVQQPDHSRAARVVEETMNGHVPKVWLSDRYSAQQNHGAAHQTCLAHLARDAAFALEHGSDDLPLRFKLWFGRAFDLAKEIASFKAATIASKRRVLEKQLAALLAATTGCDLARELQAKIRRAQRVDAPPEKPRPVAQAKPKHVASQSRSASGAQHLPRIDAGGARRGARAIPTTRAPVVTAATSVDGAPGERPLFPATALGRGPTDVVGYFAGRTSTATKTNTPIIDIPQSITILTKQQLQDRNSIDLNRALMYVPGVTVAQGEGNRDQITIRGQDTTADFYTDGIRDDAQYYRDLYNIEAVEVLKGPNALIFGRGGGGGIVNRVTKKADGERFASIMRQFGQLRSKAGHGRRRRRDQRLRSPSD